jgi:hypothetical protein
VRYPYTVNILATVQPPGVITFTNWAAIPRVNAFVEIANTKLDQLWPQIGPQFKERGSASGLSAAMSAWIGAALIDGKVFVSHTPGGHSDSVCNFGWSFDGRDMLYRLLYQPSDYRDAVWNESIALYAAAGIDARTLNPNHSYLPSGDRVWKDGLNQTAMHSYGTQVDAQEFGIFHLRDAVRHYDKTTWAHTRMAGPVGNNEIVPGDSWSFYSPSRKKVYLMSDLNSEYGHVYEVNPTSGVSGKIGLSVRQWGGSETCPIEGTEKVFVVARVRQQRLDGVYEWYSYILDFATMTKIDLLPKQTDPFAGDSLVGVVHSNKTGIVALRGSGRLSNISITDGTITDRSVSGIPQSTLRKLGVTNGLYGRLALVTVDANNQGFVLLADHDENARVMAL